MARTRDTADPTRRAPEPVAGVFQRIPTVGGGEVPLQPSPLAGCVEDLRRGSFLREGEAPAEPELVARREPRPPENQLPREGVQHRLLAGEGGPRAAASGPGEGSRGQTTPHPAASGRDPLPQGERGEEGRPHSPLNCKPSSDPGATSPAKGVDLPPYGPRNADPITDAPGSHPIETGIGATIGGAAGGLVAGVVGGPLGAVVGAIAGGAIAGGLAGKGVGELIDPTAEGEWVRGRFADREHPATEAELAAARRAFRFGLAAQARFPGRSFREVEDQLHHGWEESGEAVPWADVYESVKAGFERSSAVG